MRIITSSEYYDLLSAQYRQVSQIRTAYLAGVDRLIAESLQPGMSLLDVGGADGVRSLRLAHNAGISRVVLLDSSPAMLSRVESKDFEQVIEGDITSESTLARLGEARFDAALALWNVLGHIPSAEARTRALVNIRRGLRPKGLLFLDCNNRENTRAYGWLAARRNWLLGVFRKGGERWNFALRAKSAPDAVSYVHIFSARELEQLALAAGFEIDRLVFVDYETGQPVKSRFAGQIFLQLRRRD
ncbi:MAG TPA: class I SAM-dependent methyltransferase [Chthoniobacterales bacterium]